MSIIALLFGWTKLPTWVQELIAVAILLLLLFLAVKAWDKHIYDEGILAQQAIDQKNSAADKAVLEARATTAEKNYADSQTKLANYISANPIGAVRLCIAAPTHVQAGPVVRNSGSSAPGPAAVPTVPSGDQSSGTGTPGPDIGPMLDALTTRCAQVDAQAIELQQVH